MRVFRSLAVFVLLASNLEAAIPKFFPTHVEQPRRMEIHTPTSRDLALNSNNDHGFWSVEEFNMKLPKNFSIWLHFEQRWGANYKLLWWIENTILLNYDLTESIKKVHGYGEDSILKSISISAGISPIKLIQKNTRGNFRWVDLLRSDVELNLSLTKHQWLLTQRFRFEYFDYHAKHYKKHGLLRYRINCYTPWKWTCWDISPYVSNEFFFRENTYSASHPHGLVGGFYEDRMRIGLTSMLLKDKISFDAWWQFRPLKQTPSTHPRWFWTYQWGAEVKATF